MTYKKNACFLPCFYYAKRLCNLLSGMYTCSINDITLSVRKYYCACALELGLVLRLGLELG